MDPVTILGIVGTVVSIGDVVARSIKKLSDLKSRFRNVPRMLPTLIGQLYIIKAALDRLSTWSDHVLAKDPRYQELAMQINVSLDSFGPLLISLQQHLDEYVQDVSSLQVSDITAMSKMSFLWNESEMTVYLDLIDRQVNALNLLLQAIQCQTWVEQRNIIAEEDSQTILRLARDCTSSIIGLSDNASIFSEDTTALSLVFDFDNIVLGSKAYQAAQRSHLKHVVRIGKQASSPTDTGMDESLLEPSVQSADAISPSSDRFYTNFLDEAQDALNSLTGETAGVTIAGAGGISMRVASDDTHSRVTDVSAISSQPSTVDSVATARRARNQARTEAATAARLVAQREAAERAAGLAIAARASLTNKEIGLNKSQKTLQMSLRSYLRRKSGRPAQDAPAERSFKLINYVKEKVPNEEKCIILGTSDSGKSTLLKLLKLHFEGGYTEEERKSYAEIMWSNVVQGTRIMLEAMESLEIQLGHQEAEYHVQSIFMQPPQIEDSLASEAVVAIKELWHDEGVLEAHRRRYEYAFHESTKYYATNIDRLAAGTYIPSDEDIVRSRVKTTGITETTFDHGEITYRFFDVGGMRSERKKWIHCFENVSMIMFTVDAAAYNRMLWEDGTVNRLQEQLTLWNSIVNSRWFKKTDFVLIFTKLDELPEQLRGDSPKHEFSDFTSTNSGQALVEDYQNYLEDRFLSLIQHDEHSLSQIRLAWANLVNNENNFAKELCVMAQEMRDCRMLGTSSPFDRNELALEYATKTNMETDERTSGNSTLLGAVH